MPELPLDSVDLPDADRAEILKILDLEPDRIVSLEGYALPGETVVREAQIEERFARPAPGIDLIRNTSCRKKDIGWTCFEGSALEALVADVPETCEAPSRQIGRRVRFISHRGPSVRSLEVEVVRELVDFLCSSPALADRAWKASLRLSVVHLVRDGFRLHMTFLSSRGLGTDFMLERQCVDGACAWYLGRTSSWMTSVERQCYQEVPT